MCIGYKIKNYKNDIINSLCEIIRIPSVEGQARPGMPFGKEPDRALKYMLNLAESLGLKTKNVDGYAGYAQLDGENGQAAVLVHLDVVPAGEGWTKCSPFEGKVIGSCIYGRGASDNKGSAIAALYALKALKDEGVKLKRNARLIFGINEETGMEGVKYYLKKEKAPELSFSPDAFYPIINCEKGIMQIKFSIDNTMFENNSGITYKSGTAPNVVPGSAVLGIDKNKCDNYIDIINTAKKEGFNIKEKNNTISICAIGEMAHASTPEKGDNAAKKLLSLAILAAKNKKLKKFFTFLNEKAGADYYGNGLGINAEDDISGILTVNLGKVDVNENNAKALIDIRFPLCIETNKLIRTVENEAMQYGLDMNVEELSQPHYIPKDSLLIKKLRKAYKMIENEEAGLLSMGGGTYARTIPGKCVAFGGAGKNYHKPDEYVSIEELMHHAAIITQALYEIAK